MLQVSLRWSTTDGFTVNLICRLGTAEFQNLMQSYPDLLSKVEALTVERIESVLTVEEREEFRTPHRYASVNQDFE